MEYNENDDKMIFFTVLVAITLFNSLFKLMEPYTKDIVNWPGDKRIASTKTKRINLRVNF